jgi:hypothetical protein
MHAIKMVLMAIKMTIVTPFEAVQQHSMHDGLCANCCGTLMGWLIHCTTCKEHTSVWMLCALLALIKQKKEANSGQ